MVATSAPIYCTDGALVGWLDRWKPKLVTERTHAAEMRELEDVEPVYQQGRSAKQRGDTDEAIRLFEKAAEAGHVKATIEVSDLHLVQRNDPQAASVWWKKLADNGDAAAMFSLGSYAEIEGDEATALTWYTKASERGHAEGHFRVGIISKNRGDLDAAVWWYKKAANAGIRDAKYNLGVTYKDKGNHVESIRWYTEAADAGDDDAMLAISSYYTNIGSTELAAHWLMKAAEAGNRLANQLIRITPR
jgi:TPR repeat protein